MANNFYVADKNADGAYKANHPTMLNNHAMVSGVLQLANGLSGDAFTLKSGKVNYEFVGRKSTVVKDLSDAKLYIESISELNAAVNNGYTVTVAVLYNNTDSDAVTTSGTVKEAVTVFVTNATKSAAPVTPPSTEGALDVDIDPYARTVGVDRLHGTLTGPGDVAKAAEDALVADGYTISARGMGTVTATKGGITATFTISDTEYFSVKVDDKTYYVKSDGKEKDETGVLNLPLNKDETGFAGTGTGYVIDGTNPVYKAYSAGDINATNADVAGNGTVVNKNVVIKTGYVYVTEDGGTTKKPVAVDGTYTTSAKAAGDNGTGYKMTVNSVDSYVKYGAEITVTNKDVTLAKDHVKRTDVALNGTETVTPVAYASSTTAIAKPTEPSAATGKGTGYLVTKGVTNEYNAYASDSGTLFPDADFTVECGYVKVSTPNVDAFATNAVVSYTVAGETVAKNTAAAYAKASDGKTVVVTLALTGGNGIKTNAATGNTIELGISSTVAVTGTNTGDGAAPTTADKTVTFEANANKTYKGLTITFTVPVAEADITATHLGLTGTNLVANP